MGVEAYIASWIEILRRLFSTRHVEVEAYIASWIEIEIIAYNVIIGFVEAYIASWIEIVISSIPTPVLTSKLI